MGAWKLNPGPLEEQSVSALNHRVILLADTPPPRVILLADTPPPHSNPQAILKRLANATAGCYRIDTYAFGFTNCTTQGLKPSVLLEDLRTHSLSQGHKVMILSVLV